METCHNKEILKSQNLKTPEEFSDCYSSIEELILQHKTWHNI